MTPKDHCPACGLAWVEHNGMQLTCGELQALKIDHERLRAQLTRWRTTVTEIRDRERAKLKELENAELSALRAITQANLCDKILNLMSEEQDHERV